jgi:hypothetical protein
MQGKREEGRVNGVSHTSERRLRLPREERAGPWGKRTRVYRSLIRCCIGICIFSSLFPLPSSLMIAAAPRAARAQSLPDLLTPAELARLAADKETLDAPFPGVLVTPPGSRDNHDEKYKQPYHAVCYVYAAERATGSRAITDYARRFVVFAPDADALPTAKRVARLLLLLWGENHAHRRGYDHPGGETVFVWLSRQVGAGLSPDVGGEQFKDHIYLYNIYAERRPIEWAREVAHEYGHYALVPGISGFREPEDDANGVLGERLFLKWLQEDLRTGRLKAENLPFVTPEQLEEYLVRQVTPLIRRFAREGADARQMAKTDAGGMDYYTGFTLYLDSVYGSKAVLDAFAYTRPRQEGVFVRATDFLRGALESLAGATEFTLTPPFRNKESRSESLQVYLPRGEYTVTLEGPVRAWEIAADPKGVHLFEKNHVLITAAGWRKLTVTLAGASDVPVNLAFHRRGTEIQ